MSSLDSQSLDTDTIAAVATAPGMGGIGVIRLSGSESKNIAEQLGDCDLQPRHAHFQHFYSAASAISSKQQRPLLDSGIALYFPGPASFTGEDVVELQIHGGPVVLDIMLAELLALGARQARPGEFSERAFLNDKIDLVQAEAIADLIGSGSEEAARGALKSLQGEFSRQLHRLAEQLLSLRTFVEAALDFPEEEVDFLNDQQLHQRLDQLQEHLQQAVQNAQQGTLLKEGISVAIAGQPNAGKSSLLNALAATDTAIVTEVAGTTRDVLREQINIDGLAIHLVDTAGLRQTKDAIELEGIKRAGKEFEKADLVLLIVDSQHTKETEPEALWPGDKPSDEILQRTFVIRNKIDLLPENKQSGPQGSLAVSARTGAGIEELKSFIKSQAGFNNSNASPFMARRRHLDALYKAHHLVKHGHQQLRVVGAGELLAEDLRQAQQCLDDITGKVTSDALLGEIFSSFCIGK